LNTRGRHLLVEYTGCSLHALNDLERIEALMNEAAKAAGATIVASVFKPFEPHGVSGVVVIEESHLSIHTWPEHGYAAVDFYTCGHADPQIANDVLAAGLGAKTGQSMGHISMSGDHGAIESLAGLDIGKKMFLHINNSNPALLHDSNERRTLEQAGWQIPVDGTEIVL